MMLSVEYTPQTADTLKKMDKHTRALIIAWIEKNLVGRSDPRAHGKSLTANRSGQWQYRIGDYRLLADINDQKVTILFLNIGPRKEIYNTDI